MIYIYGLRKKAANRLDACLAILIAIATRQFIVFCMYVCLILRQSVAEYRE